MPIDPDAVGARSRPLLRSWDRTDCLLYSLGVGAGGEDPGAELAFITENTAGVEQRVLPTMATVLASLPRELFDRAGSFDRTKLVHGTQGITLHREIPVEGSLRSEAQIVGVYDKGSGAVIATRSSVVLAETGEALADMTSAAFVRGAGGFGGDRGPSGPNNAPPERPADHQITYPTRADQALLYRLTGDRNPLHSDPAFAAAGGFERPILHGLCTYGFTGRALLHCLCDGDPARFCSIDARFSSPVIPGERLAVRMWVVGRGEAVFQTAGADGRVVLDAGRCTFTS